MEYRIIRKESSVELRDDELMHYKYIKRVKGKNGKWHYYYNTEQLKKDTKDKLGLDEKAAVIEARTKLTSTINHPEASSKEIQWRQDNLSKAFDAYYKTPIGKLEKASDAIYRGKETVNYMLKRKLRIN